MRVRTTNENGVPFAVDFQRSDGANQEIDRENDRRTVTDGTVLDCVHPVIVLERRLDDGGIVRSLYLHCRCPSHSASKGLDALDGSAVTLLGSGRTLLHLNGNHVVHRPERIS